MIIYYYTVQNLKCRTFKKNKVFELQLNTLNAIKNQFNYF